MAMIDRIRALRERGEIPEVFTINQLLELHPLGNSRHMLDGQEYKAISISTSLANQSFGPANQRIGTPSKRGLQPINYLKHPLQSTYSIATEEQIRDFFLHYECEEGCSISQTYPHACSQITPPPALRTDANQIEESSAAELAGRIFEDAKNTRLEIQDPYLQSYPHMCGFFDNKETLTEGELVQAANMVYGWMPTILTLHTSDNDHPFRNICNLLDRSCESVLNENELEVLAAAINNSMVGASKLLHFRSPSRYPIWDSRVCTYFRGVPFQQHHMRNVKFYTEYMRILKLIAKDERCEGLRSRMSQELRYDISKLRALELVMFLNSKRYS